MGAQADGGRKKARKAGIRPTDWLRQTALPKACPLLLPADIRSSQCSTRKVSRASVVIAIHRGGEGGPGCLRLARDPAARVNDSAAKKLRRGPEFHLMPSTLASDGPVAGEDQCGEEAQANRSRNWCVGSAAASCPRIPAFKELESWEERNKKYWGKN